MAKNINLGNLPLTQSGTLQRKKMYQDTKEVLTLLKLPVSPKTQCKNLSIAQQQMVEIGRAISREAKIIIMDEPTSSLTDREKEVLFDVIRMLKEKGVCVLYVSHKLEEIKEIADRVTVLRDGQKVITADNRDVTKEQIVEYMIGRKIKNYFGKQEAEIGEVVLEVKNLCRYGKFHDISFSVRSGEVLGFYGLVGAGRTEIADAVFGTEKADSGEIVIEGKAVRISRPRDAIRKGICLVPEDRKTLGLVLKLDVKTNLAMVKARATHRFGFIRKGIEEQVSAEYVDVLSIKTPSLHQIVSNLSGGNQQKVVIAKWLSMEPKVLILDEPTRGIDIGAKAEIYSLISQLTQKGVALIVISSELPEILGICDRVATICEGRLTGTLERKDFSSSAIIKASLGEVCNG